MKLTEAVVISMEQKRNQVRRQPRLPAVIDRAVAYLKAAERQALLRSLEQQDPAVAEMLRVAAATYDEACKWVLLAFDDVSRKPSV